MYFSGGRDGEVCMCVLGGVRWSGVEWRLVVVVVVVGRDCRFGCWCDRGQDVISLIR